jgi:hypothetical protein
MKINEFTILKIKWCFGKLMNDNQL